jgi:hypothetical protein
MRRHTSEATSRFSYGAAGWCAIYWWSRLVPEGVTHIIDEFLYNVIPLSASLQQF